MSCAAWSFQRGKNGGTWRVQCELEEGHSTHQHKATMNSEMFFWADCDAQADGGLMKCVLYARHDGKHQDKSGDTWDVGFGANASASFYQSKVSEETLAALRNSGIDVTCGACMSVAFAGVTTSAHTCESSKPVALILFCPVCHARHIDVGIWATRPHRSHECQACGVTWRPAVVETVGVARLPWPMKEGA